MNYRYSNTKKYLIQPFFELILHFKSNKIVDLPSFYCDTLDLVNKSFTSQINSTVYF